MSTKIVDSVIDSIDAFLSILHTGIKITEESYCDVETADSPNTLVARDGSLLSMIRINGAMGLLGPEEFDRLHQGLTQGLQTIMSRAGHQLQVFFNYDKEKVAEEIASIYQPAKETAKKLSLDLDDLFTEREKHLAQYCAVESVYFVLWTRPSALTKEQFKSSAKRKQKFVRENQIPPFKNAQNPMAAIPDLRDTHDSYVRSVMNDLAHLKMSCDLLEVHEAVYQMRMTVDPDFTDKDWRPYLPGDKIPVRAMRKTKNDYSNLLWPPLTQQLMPRDAEIFDLRTVRIGDRIYAPVHIELFPKDIKPFVQLFIRTLPTWIPWRMSYLIDSAANSSLNFKKMIAKILSFTAAQNRLLSDSADYLTDLQINSDEAIVKLRVAATTWAPANDIPLLRTRVSQLVKAIEGWGSCEVGEVSGDAFAGAVSTMLGITGYSVATPSVAPLSDVMYMLPITRPASPWMKGALLFRTPDGKPWPFQPGSRLQTTWIDLLYARPGSGKSVLANTLNLALCLSGGIQRLPRIAIVDIGPSSSGLISLLKEALPYEERHLAAYHRLRMTPEYSINPFDTQLGCRLPTSQERAFLVNFLTLLATPIGAERPYDGISDLSGMVVDELYKSLVDDANPTRYTRDLEALVDGILEDIGFVGDQQTTWWEVTDALFAAGFVHEAMLAQRYAVPLLADAASICRVPAIEDLYGKVQTPTGENLINAFTRTISAAVREYPLLSRITAFDLGAAKIVSLDLDEVAKSGGDAADRQTAVMYMLARYVLARHYYLTEEHIKDMPEGYREYHEQRITELREDPKRLVYDEFHRTSKVSAVRDQVILDMREGRKWNVQIALISQALDDFDPVMVEFATSIYIMDAGPEQAIKKSAGVFGLSETAQIALRSRVHGPRETGSTFLAQFATKEGSNMQLLTLTLGPIELWAFSTTVEDANLRNKLYAALGPKEARRVLATVFPSGSATKLIETRLSKLKEKEGLIAEEVQMSVVDELAQEILRAYAENPDFKRLTF